MDKLFKSIKNNITLKRKFYTIDNFIFRLHYRYTTMALFTAALLITTQELFGEHIKCVQNAGSGVDEKVMERFCFSMTTFTVVRYLNHTLLDRGEIIHPGVGPMASVAGGGNGVKHHAYYQWVPFVIVLQLFLFYLPHLIWKNEEGGRMMKLVAGLENAAFAIDKSAPVTIGAQTYPTKASVQMKFEGITKYYKDHLIVNRYWSFCLIACELGNLGNVVLNIYLTDVFLSGQFRKLGLTLLAEGVDSSVDILDVVFPKMTKCTFHKYGPSGSLQPIDAICVMALNIFNEKTYVFLWFWFALLLVASAACVLWRLLAFAVYRRSKTFNELVFKYASSGRLSIWKLMAVTQNGNYLDWLFLVYLAKNMDSIVFFNFFNGFADEYHRGFIHDEDNCSDGPEDDDSSEDGKFKREAIYVA